MKDAQENEKCMELIKNSLQIISSSNSIDEDKKAFKNLIMSLYVVVKHSSHFSKAEKITQLFKKLSFNFIQHHSNRISLDEIFNGDPQKSLEKLYSVLDCCQEYAKNFNEVFVLMYLTEIKSL